MKALLACVHCVGLLVGACDDSAPVKETIPDAGSSGGSSGGTSGTSGTSGVGGPKDCFDDPRTHFELINACTNAQRIEKNPTLAKLLPDGGLPPLQ